MAAVQRTLLGGGCMAALWLHDAQIQKHVSHTTSEVITLHVWDKDLNVWQ